MKGGMLRGQEVRAEEKDERMLSWESWFAKDLPPCQFVRMSGTLKLNNGEGVPCPSFLKQSVLIDWRALMGLMRLYLETGLKISSGIDMVIHRSVVLEYWRQGMRPLV